MNVAARMRRLARDECGATAIEYGLLAALIAVAIVALLQDIGTSTSGSLNAAAAEFQTPE